MGHISIAQRLRRFARALVRETTLADALVLETLANRNGEDIEHLFAVMIATMRSKAATEAHLFLRSHHHESTGDIAQAFHALPLELREVLALVAIEQLDYDGAAKAAGLTHEALVERLAEARIALARHVEDERPTLRLVKNS
jgi:DNA-directed RNA polymerase specialized sigma24 family protein